jgi:hypothetical protein
MPKTTPKLPGFPTAEINSEMSKMNTGKHDFSITVLDQLLDFMKDVIGGSTDDSRTHLGNDAEATVKQAAILNFYKCSMTSIEETNTLW